MVRYVMLMLGGFVLVCIISLFSGCGTNNDLKVHGNATVNHVISIDFDVMLEFCENSFEEIEDVEKCKTDMMELIQTIIKVSK